jgi:Metal-dependent amidase/aminoacylase/carboxypeptidase
MDQITIQRVSDLVDSLRDEMVEMSLAIHDHPELGHQEFFAKGLQVEKLRHYGFEVEENYCDIPTAYRAVYKGKKPGPKIAMLAEYDALPKLGHGCGHNLICMMSLASAIAMRPFADEYGAEIYVIGTPAEETAGSKVEMSRKGAFKELDVAMMAHPANRDESSMNSMAICVRRFEFFRQDLPRGVSPGRGAQRAGCHDQFLQPGQRAAAADQGRRAHPRCDPERRRGP